MNNVGTKNQTNRDEWVQNILKNIPQGGRVLDAGAGEGRYKNFCQHLKYVSQDFGQYCGQGDAKGLQTGNWDQTKLDFICDIVSIPQPNASFDAILCTEVFEHLPEPVLAIKEFSRLLKVGGHLIVTAPFCSLTHFSPYHYYSGFNNYFYEWHLKKNDFELIEIARNGNYFEYLAQEVRRLKLASLQYAQVRPSFFENFALQIILNLLDRSSRNDQGSNELLCFGYHVLARKSGCS